VPNLDDTIELLRQHRAEALERAEQACADTERFSAALIALGVDTAIDDGALTRLADAAGIRATATKRRPDPPQPPKAASPARTERLREPISYGEVALIANNARERGEPMRDAVAKHFGINPSAADMRISTARKKGFDIPRVLANKPAATAPAAPAEARPGRPTFTPEDATRIIDGGVDDDD
jgi:ribosomal protein L12E/L44/L45/RPP1/RPP2